MAELRKNLCTVFEELHSGKLESKNAKELANVAGKIISSVTAELKAAEINKTNHRIAFLMSSEITDTEARVAK
jgi:hypothetical protein